MTLRLTNLTDDQIPIECAGLAPTAFAGQSRDALLRHSLLHGNRRRPLGELFRVEGDPADDHWTFAGECRNLHGVGSDLTAGTLTVEGSVGTRAGQQMRGGRLEIRGDAGDWLGAEMRGGLIRVRGNAGSHVGAATAGANRGMSGGTILIDGNAGSEAGLRMRRGLLAIAGSAGANLGYQMLASTILVFGGCNGAPGTAMRRGTIGIFGSPRPAPLPTFKPGYRGPLPMLRLLESQLAAESFAVDRLPQLADAVELFHGDFLHSGRGELLLS
jgi:formylmethanofuran dehydrogenase subunit C